MATTRVLMSNSRQVIRLPAELRLPDGVKRVSIRACGFERVIAPISQTWDSFFLDGAQVADEFLPERPNQLQPEREAL